MNIQNLICSVKFGFVVPMSSLLATTSLSQRTVGQGMRLNCEASVLPGQFPKAASSYGNPFNLIQKERSRNGWCQSARRGRGLTCVVPRAAGVRHAAPWETKPAARYVVRDVICNKKCNKGISQRMHGQ